MAGESCPKPGRAQTCRRCWRPTGRLKGDLTALQLGRWNLVDHGVLLSAPMAYALVPGSHRRPGVADVAVRDISDGVVGFSLSGPKSREVLEKLTHQDVSHAAMPFMGCQTLDIGLIRAKVARLSVAGELGYEINCSALEHIALREMLLEAGAASGIREYGFYALNSLRLEKSFGIWSAEFTQGYTAGMTGMDRWIAWDKGMFVGRDAAIAERDRNSAAQRLVTLEVDADKADASGFEPIWRSGERVGFHHLGRLWPHGPEEPRYGVDRAGARHGGDRAFGAYRRRRARRAGDCALAL